MKPELYNPDPDANPILDELDELLFGEGKVAPAYIPKKTGQTYEITENGILAARRNPRDQSYGSKIWNQYIGWVGRR